MNEPIIHNFILQWQYEAMTIWYRQRTKKTTEHIVVIDNLKTMLSQVESHNPSYQLFIQAMVWGKPRRKWHIFNCNWHLVPTPAWDIKKAVFMSYYHFSSINQRPKARTVLQYIKLIKAFAKTRIVWVNYLIVHVDIVSFSILCGRVR